MVSYPYDVEADSQGDGQRAAARRWVHVATSRANPAEIFAAFLAFVVHHGALTDAHLAPGLRRALTLAQRAPQRLRDGKAWEARIDDPAALNLAGFALLCGNYYTRLQGITQGLAWVLPPEEVADEGEAGEDDGGWGPEPGELVLAAKKLTRRRIRRQGPRAEPARRCAAYSETS